jgi:spermidine synthase
MASTFPKMIDIVPEGEHGIARVEHFEVSEDESRFSSLRGAMDYVPEGRYAKLKVNGRLMMSDTSMEHRTNYGVVRESRGNVLIAGLGLGMILHPILAKPEVLSVTVVEKYPDVISLIGPTVLHEKLTIVEGDIYEWKPAKGTKFDTIYFDIWSEQSTDDLDDMRKLHCRFRPYKVKEGWMDSWRRDYLKYEKQRNKRNGWC